MRRLLTAFAIAAMMTLPVTPGAAADDSVEVTFWQSVQDTKDPAELEAYLEAYPKGKFVPLARIRLQELHETGSEAAKPTLESPEGTTSDGASTDTAESQAQETGRSGENVTLTAKLRKTTIDGKSRTWLGVKISGAADLEESQRSCFGLIEAKGVLVNEVLPESAAKDAGLQPGDIIQALDGKTVESASLLSRTLCQKVTSAESDWDSAGAADRASRKDATNTGRTRLIYLSPARLRASRDHSVSGRIGQKSQVPISTTRGRGRTPATLSAGTFNVRFWHLADILCTRPYVCFWG